MKQLILIIVILDCLSCGAQNVEYYNYTLMKALEDSKNIQCKSYFCSTITYDSLSKEWESDIFTDFKPIDLFSDLNSKRDFFLKPSNQGFDTFWVKSCSVDSMVLRNLNFDLTFKAIKPREKNYLEMALMTGVYKDDSIKLELTKDGKILENSSYIGDIHISRSNLYFVVLNCNQSLPDYSVKIDAEIGSSQLSFLFNKDMGILTRKYVDGRLRYFRLSK